MSVVLIKWAWPKNFSCALLLQPHRSKSPRSAPAMIMHALHTRTSSYLVEIVCAVWMYVVCVCVCVSLSLSDSSSKS